MAVRPGVIVNENIGNVMRREADMVECLKWGWVYHHLGVPTTEQKPGETYIPHLKFAVSGFSDSPFGVEWMRFDPDCTMPELIQKIPHLAFAVKDIAAEIESHQLKVIVPLNEPSPGIKVAMIEHNGAPLELIQFDQ